jgi:Arc/MetJ-type ribon-helix-helix transcriptional regulator
MQETSVHLTPEETEAPRSTAARTGRSRSELIREGVRPASEGTEPTARAFRNLGKGHGGGAPYRRWDAEDLYEKVARGR